MKNKSFLSTVVILLVSGILMFISYVGAEEITILYTGDSHGMIYPCTCPIETDGGLGRRATLIKRLEKEYPEALILDSGNFFAGGTLDDYSQNSELDSKRTQVNIKGIEAIGYDAVAIGDSEFNFGEEFFKDNLAKINLRFLSCNLDSKIASDFIIKEVSGLKIAILGITPLSVRRKVKDLQIEEPGTAVAKTLDKIKQQGADLIIALSQLSGKENLALIEDFKDIDLVIEGAGNSQDQPFIKISDTLLLRPSRQARKLGIAHLSIKDKEIANYSVEQIRLSDEITDDPDIVSMLPVCFQDYNCKKEGFIGSCSDPGGIKASCMFKKANKIKLLVLIPNDCVICDSKKVVDFLKKQFAGLNVSYLYYPDKKALKMVKDFDIPGLPIYFLGEEIEKEDNFNNLKANLEKKANYYMLSTKFTGLSYLLGRDKTKGRLDLFLSLYDDNAAPLLSLIKEFNPIIHFLAIEHQGHFDAAAGQIEVEEYLRAVCINKHYPDYFWDYISCRVSNIRSSWWDDCTKDADLDKIKVCAKSEEGKNLLIENISLNKELEIMFGPTYLLDNYQIFGSKGVPSKDELEKIIKR